MTKSLDIDATTITVAASALAQFREEYPNRIPVWVNSEAGQLDIKISSICKTNSSEQMKKHVWFHKLSSILEL
tara:strand:- start:662 stop:880 length:219 start_codon:yes stop_codon:yes gene_type:complete